ncbi:MAG: exodeoxyribonuclease VII large subunit [Ilumatobacteraceae bacterium]
MSDTTYGVVELTAAINDSLRDRFGSGVWVVGEISGLVDRGPHTYFTLVEESADGKAVLNVQLFANVKRTITPILRRSRLELADGTRVRVFGTLDVYPPTGRLGLKLSDIDPEFTIGDIGAAREALLARLLAEDLIEANRRLPLPVAPMRLGLVTSIGSAAWHDFCNELERSGFGFEVSAIDARVQGDEAEEMVAAAIRSLGRRGVDLIVVIRGGGSRNDLAAFDAEGIARAIATSPIPVFTGIGHEIDRSVADEVAGRAWKTPTACAGALVDMVGDYVLRTENAWVDIVRLSTARLDGAGVSLMSTAQRVARQTHVAVSRSDERLASRARRVSAVRRRLDDETNRFDRASQRLTRAAGAATLAAERQLDDRERRRGLLDPSRLLQRGWSISTGPDGRIVRSTADVASGATLRTRLADGVVVSTVDEVERDG